MHCNQRLVLLLHLFNAWRVLSNREIPYQLKYSVNYVTFKDISSPTEWVTLILSTALSIWGKKKISDEGQPNNEDDREDNPNSHKPPRKIIGIKLECRVISRL